MRYLIITLLTLMIAIPSFAAQTQLDISKLFNNDGISAPGMPRSGSLDKGGYSYPADEFPADGKITTNNVLFRLADPAALRNNISCTGQEIRLPKRVISRINVLATAVNGSFIEEMRVTRGDGTVYNLDLAISDWCVTAQYNEQVGISFNRRNGPSASPIKCNIWQQTIYLKKNAKANSITLPKNPNIHIFAMTVE
ncbi:MAG: hypothetical protein ACYC0V_19265 [Armatimonadota bacterium]